MSNTVPEKPNDKETSNGITARWKRTYYCTVIVLCFGSFTIGKGISALDKTKCTIAIAEQGAVVLDAALDRQGASKEVLEKEIRQPILSVINKYSALGYLVVDISKDEQGNMAVSGIPNNNIDITAEMRDAIKQATNRREETTK